MSSDTGPQPRPYAEHVADYAQAGWPCILPVPPRDKFPPPVGFTGANGRDTDPLTLVDLATRFPAHSIALRMPEGVIGIDVDSYVKGEGTKRGAETLVHCEAKWGTLPPTYSSTARGLGPSRIYFYRVPAGRYATKLSGVGEDGTPTGDVEIIQRHHRYAVVWPSPNPSASPDAQYQWYAPDFTAAARVPGPGDLAELPQAWVEALAAGASEQGPASASHASGEALLDQLLDDTRPECAEITNARMLAEIEFSKDVDPGSRHDTMLPRVHHLVQLAAHGHPGAGLAVLTLRELWERATAGEDRGAELDSMLLTSARKAVTLVGAHQVPRDPCFGYQSDLLPAPPVEQTAGDGSGGDGQDEDAALGDLTILERPRWVSVREFIGTETFDPAAGLDQTLAEAVLARTYPALRYAYDANAWLLRSPDRWEVHGRLSPWAVARVASMMPLGDPTAEKGSEQLDRAKRRTRLMSTAGARAVAGKMDDLVAGGMHPAAVALGDLDADPEVLWAGGVPWSLRASLERPTPAGVDWATPHTHSAAVTPERVETPLWDAFTEAVWPDPEIRAWAIRVLAVSLSGYADRALPILLGETGRGKTQVVALVMSVLGSYAHAANPKLLNANGNDHDTIVYQLKGRRLSFIDEAPSEAKSGQERLKQLTGGGELEARQMQQNPVTFRPTHTLVLTANDEPLLTDPAVRSRARLIPCEGDPEQVRSARAAIGAFSSPGWRAEAPGVLAKLMSETAGWLADPLSAGTAAAPERIRYLAEHLAAEQDPVSVWVSEETEPDGVGTPSRELYQAFTASCLRNNLRRDQIPSETKWGRSLQRLGYPAIHTRTGKHRPLKLRTGGFYTPPAPPSPEVFLQAPQSPAPAPAPAPQGPETDTPSGPTTDQYGPRTGGSVTGCDGLVTGLEPNPSQTNPQVNPSVSLFGDGCDGLKPIYTHEETPPHTNNLSDPGEQPVTRHIYGNTGGDLGFQRDGLGVTNPSQGESEVPSADKPAAKRTRKPQSEETKAKAAAKREEKRQAAIELAAGGHYRLPALVTRDLAVREIGLEDADALLATITATGAALTVDVEHTGYPLGHEDYALRTVQLGNEHFTVVLDPGEHRAVAEHHLCAARVLHAHSATADLIPLHHAGIIGDLDEAWSRMHDTVIPAKLADPASTGSDPGLKKLATAVLGKDAVSAAADDARAELFKAGKWLTEVKVTTGVERSGWAQVDSRCGTMLRYAAADVLDDAALAARLPVIPEPILHRERTAQRMVARVADEGLRIDGAQVEMLLGQHTQARDEAANLVRELSGGAIENPGSNDQVGQTLAALGARLPQTKTGKPSVAEGVLDPLRGTEGPVGALATAVLAYREHDTAVGLFLEPYQQLVTRGDGRARPTVYTLGADTGRMSCVRPNLQQVPRLGGFRACITADPGEVLVSADFAGVELRVAAALSGDPNLLAILEDPERDLHWEITRMVFGPDAPKEMRYRMKRGVFGRIYGGGVGAVAAGVGIDHPTAKRVIDAMDAITPVLAEWSAQARGEVDAGRTQWTAYSGRIIHLPKQAAHAAGNYKIQGTARELLIDALLRWEQTPWGRAVVLPVHDEVVTKVPQADAERATAALVECMTSELNGVKIIAEASAPSFAWADST